MRRLSIICIVTTLLSCSKQNSDSKLDDSSAVSSDKDTSIAVTVQADNGGIYLTSTYDDPSSDIERHKASLKELSDSSAFSTIHHRLLSTLDKKHQAYFNFKLDYELLCSSTGDLFQNNKEDKAFIVYDKKYSRVSILVYDESKNEYSELFRNIKVQNGLENVECNYGSSGTLDYQLAYELTYHRDDLIKEPLKQIEYTTIKIVDISKDEDFVLENGCFAKNFSTEGSNKSLCIPTSSVYNNWECLTYDKSKSEFVIVYGQAFAD
jgi:hypothetical protein